MKHNQNLHSNHAEKTVQAPKVCTMRVLPLMILGHAKRLPDSY